MKLKKLNNFRFCHKFAKGEKILGTTIFRGTLIIATTNGVYSYKENKLKRIILKDRLNNFRIKVKRLFYSSSS